METLTGDPPAVASEEQARREIETLTTQPRSARAGIDSHTQVEADALTTSVEPIGVIAGLIPTTGSDATPPVRVLAAIQS